MVTWTAYGLRPGQDQLDQQAAFLEASIEAGSAEEMQRLFPEGYFFQHVLTAMTTVRADADSDGEIDAAQVRDHLTALDSTRSTDVFGGAMTPEHGIFHAGWTLQLAVDIYELTGSAADADAVRWRAQSVADALAASDTGFAESYPGQFWPCDSVVAAAALSRAAIALDQPRWLLTLRTWRARTHAHLDPQTWLLPHRVDSTGAILEGSRGSSQSVIQTFTPDIDRALDGSVDSRMWRRFTDQFVVRELGLVGVREYPVGVTGAGDVDSGPLVRDVSASASAVTLAAARRIGDRDLADALSREADLLGFPLTVNGERRYAFGRLPVGDAFVAFARSRPIAPGVGPDSGSSRPLWEAWIAMAALPAAIGFGWVWIIGHPADPDREFLEAATAWDAGGENTRVDLD